MKIQHDQIERARENVQTLPIRAPGMSPIDILHAVVNEIECQGFKKARVAVFEDPPCAKVVFHNAKPLPKRSRLFRNTKTTRHKDFLLHLNVTSPNQTDGSFLLEYAINENS